MDVVTVDRQPSARRELAGVVRDGQIIRVDGFVPPPLPAPPGPDPDDDPTKPGKWDTWVFVGLMVYVCALTWLAVTVCL